jgi:amino acid permease
MSIFKPMMKTRSFPAKIFFILSLVFAGPVSFLLYDFYVNWSESSTKTIAWYLAFAYDALGAWGGVAIAFTIAFACYVIGINLHKAKQKYYWK